MQRISENIHDYCLRSKHRQYQEELNIVQEELVDIIAKTNKPESRIPIDEFVRLRWGTQQRMLERYKMLRTIADDAIYELSFLYFLIDYHLLQFAK